MRVCFFAEFLYTGGSSSGRTTVSDTVYLGSNPSPPANFVIRLPIINVCSHALIARLRALCSSTKSQKYFFVQ